MLLTTFLVASPLSVSACTVPPGAVAGVGVDKLGQLVGYLQVCHGQIDGASLYSDESDDLGSWTAPEPVTDSASWSLADPPSGWTEKQPLARLDANTRYTLYGWTEDNSWSASPVDFTLADLGTLGRGQVLYWAGDPNSGGGGDLVVSEEEFRGDACKIVD